MYYRVEIYFYDNDTKITNKDELKYVFKKCIDILPIFFFLYICMKIDIQKIKIMNHIYKYVHKFNNY
jgi:hypothetical protein